MPADAVRDGAGEEARMPESRQPDPRCFGAPSPQHALLRERAGVWDVECTDFASPDGPTTTTARETVELVGPFWAVSRFEARLGGRPHEGRATIGHDPHRERWHSTWIGSTDPFPWSFAGDREHDTGTMTLRGRGPVPHGEGLADHVTVERRLGPDERTLEMSLLGEDGEPSPLFAYRDSRRR
jgi:hypothetical protein